MSNRRGAPCIDKESVQRRKWYAATQANEFKGDSSSSDDDEVLIYVEKKSAIEEEVEEKKKETAVRVASRPPTRQFMNFASALGQESSNRVEQSRAADKFDKEAMLDLDREVPPFPPDQLDKCVHKISNPPEPK
jgi:tRNA(Leu) C34 or U34 (ribose-2'-O)-methylase TrmL